MVTQLMHNVMASMILAMIISGYITTSDQIPGTVDERDWHLVAATCHLENGENGDLCILLTGSVVINRKLYCSWCPDTIEGVLFQGYKSSSCPQQYATHTLVNLDKVDVPERTKMLAKYLLVFGPICPKEVIYQSQNKKLGHGHYAVIDTPQGPEYFAYE